MDAPVRITTEGGRPVEALSRLIEARSKWLHETTEDACAAVAIQVLKSLRSATREASPEKIARKAKVSLAKNLHVGFPKIGGRRKFRVLTSGKIEFRPKENERIIYTPATYPLWENKVFVFTDDFRGPEKTVTYYVVAPSQHAAQKWAQGKIARRVGRHSGLAKTALGILMHSVATNSQGAEADSRNAALARENTRKTVAKGGGRYGLRLEDLLDYSMAALRGGESTIDSAMMKAANVTAGLINHRCADILGFRKLETPFPEIARRRS